MYTFKKNLLVYILNIFVYNINYMNINIYCMCVFYIYIINIHGTHTYYVHKNFLLLDVINRCPAQILMFYCILHQIA